MNKIYKSILAATAAVIVAGASLVVPATDVLAWGDSNKGRDVYTLEQINNGELGDKITFNSITDGKIGDERNFVGTRLSSSTVNKWEADEVTVEDGQVYTIRLYVHNNSPKGKDRIAEGVTASFSLPTTVSTSQTVIGYLNSTNADPVRYWDEVKFVSEDDFYIEYVAGSAKYTNSKMGTVALSDSVITSGATLGYESLDGNIPGCYDYDGQVTIEVKVHKSVTSKLSKTVRLKGAKGWNEYVDAKIGDEVEFQIEYVNLTSDVVDNVMIRDILPNNLEYVADSTYLYNANYQSGVKVVENTVTTSGINIGSYGPKGNAYVRFTAKVVNKSLVCGENQLVNWASSTVNSRVSKDDASVMVTRTEECGPADLKVSKTVRIKGTTDWKETVEAKVGDEVEFQIEYTNTGEKEAKNVIILDTLPANLEFVAGSTYLYNSSNKDGKNISGNAVVTSGLNIGDYVASGNAFVRFTAKVVNNSIACGKTNQLTNWASATADSKTAKDDATVLTTIECPDDPTPPHIVPTGPTEITAGAVGAGLTVTSLGYVIANRKKLFKK